MTSEGNSENTDSSINDNSSKIANAEISEAVVNDAKASSNSSDADSAGGDLGSSSKKITTKIEQPAKKQSKAAIAAKQKADAIAEEFKDYTPTPITIASMLKSGVHFGHQTDRWNPAMASFIYGERNNIHIINLEKTMQAWEEALKIIERTAGLGGNVLFVGTKKSLRTVVSDAARRCGEYFVTSRWLGGTLTNFRTIKNSVERMRKLEELLEKAALDDSEIKLSKKERLTISRNLEKLEANLGGIRDLRGLPRLLFVVDVKREAIAIAEARRLHIPVVGLVDTNSDPRTVDYAIPSNDDSSRAVGLFANAVADAILKGRKMYSSQFKKENEAGGEAKSQQSGGATPSEEVKTAGAAPAAI